MTEDEFWASTLAKVDALQNAAMDRDKRRDYFPALIASMDLKDTTAGDILALQYPEKDVMITHDPDYGAQCDWRGMKAAMKGLG